MSSADCSSISTPGSFVGSFSGTIVWFPIHISQPFITIAIATVSLSVGFAALVFVFGALSIARRGARRSWRLALYGLASLATFVLLARPRIVPQSGEDFALLWTVGADPARARQDLRQLRTGRREAEVRRAPGASGADEFESLERWRELAEAGADIKFSQVHEDIRVRDRRDRDRAIAPLVLAADAILLDTTDFGYRRRVQSRRASDRREDWEVRACPLRVGFIVLSGGTAGFAILKVRAGRHR